MEFVWVSFDRIQNLKNQYYLLEGEVSDEEEFQGEDSEDDEDSRQDKSAQRSGEKQQYAVVDDFETVETVKKLEETWIDFYYYTIDLTAANLSYISNHHAESFPKLPEDA